MLLVPTSMTTAIYWGDSWLTVQPFMGAAASILPVAYAYCCWEMLISRIGGSRPSASRWIWLVVAGAFLVVAIVLSGLTPWPVTFNAGTTDWISTSWGSVIGQYCLLVFEILALVLLALRIADAVALGRAKSWPHALWRMLVLLATIACGVLLALNAMSLTSGLQNAAIATVFGLTVLGVGSLAAVAVISRMRGTGDRELLDASV